VLGGIGWHAVVVVDFEPVYPFTLEESLAEGVAILARHPTVVDHVETELGVSGREGKEGCGEASVEDEFEHGWARSPSQQFSIRDPPQARQGRGA